MGVCGPDVETTLEILDDTAVAQKLELQSSSKSESLNLNQCQILGLCQNLNRVVLANQTVKVY